MPAWWSSPQSLGTVANWITWLGVGVAAFGVLMTVAGTLVRNRRDALLAVVPRLEATEKVLAPRQFTSEQRARILEVVRRNPDGCVATHALAGDSEAWALAEQFRQIFFDAGVCLRPSRGILATGSFTGVLLLVHSKESAPRWAAGFQEALEAMGWSAPAEVSELPEAGEVIIRIGSKPPARTLPESLIGPSP